MFDLTGKTALVTGGNSGIGLAIAVGLAQAGAHVAILGRDVSKNAKAAAEITAITGRATPVVVAQIDVEAEVTAAVAEAAAALGGLDILVANAGTNDRKEPQEYSVEEWRKLIAVNLDSVYLTASAAYPEFKKRGGGKIITTGSMTSLFGLGRAAPYSAAKSGVIGLTRSLACAWAGDNIQVNSILPGWIETDLTRVAKVQIPGLNEKVVTRTPMGRWGKPQDLAGAAVFLASSASDFVTGVSLPVDGGFSISG